ncbi:MAG TPA: hypothetical protein VF620_03795 [Allosphingosinicella sp.]|jgi:hypothetical protein
MRYQPIETKNVGPDASVAAVWPSFEDALLNRRPLEQDRTGLDRPQPPFSPAAAAPDVPAAVGRLVIAPYVALLGVFFALFAGSPVAFFSIAVCAVFVAMYFAVPTIFFAVEADPARRPTLSQFMRGGLQTLTGRTGGRDALIQMLIVPVLVTLGLTAMGIIGKIFIG